jgi:hypothetical protein
MDTCVQNQEAILQLGNIPGKNHLNASIFQRANKPHPAPSG